MVVRTEITRALRWAGCLSLMVISNAYALPHTIAGAHLVAHVLGEKSADNPNAQAIYLMHFQGKHKYQFQTLGDEHQLNGFYSYKRGKTGTAEIIFYKSSEIAPNNIDSKMVMVETTKTKGLYQHISLDNKGNIARRNSAEYYFVKAK